MEEKKQTGSSKDIEENKVIAAIGYISILCFVPLLMAKESKFAQFHAKQGLVLFIIGVIVMLINVVIGWIPFIGWAIALTLSAIVIILSLLGLIKALAGEWYEVPLVSDFAKKLGI